MIVLPKQWRKYWFKLMKSTNYVHVGTGKTSTQYKLQIAFFLKYVAAYKCILILCLAGIWNWPEVGYQGKISLAFFQALLLLKIIKWMLNEQFSKITCNYPVSERFPSRSAHLEMRGNLSFLRNFCSFLQIWLWVTADVVRTCTIGNQAITSKGSLLSLNEEKEKGFSVSQSNMLLCELYKWKLCGPALYRHHFAQVNMKNTGRTTVWERKWMWSWSISGW